MQGTNTENFSQQLHVQPLTAASKNESQPSVISALVLITQRHQRPRCCVLNPGRSSRDIEVCKIANSDMNSNSDAFCFCSIAVLPLLRLQENPFPMWSMHS
eukprot:4504993-Amphidinium_carterae.1